MKKKLLIVLTGIAAILPTSASDPTTILPDESIGYILMESGGKWMGLSEHPVGKGNAAAS